MKLETGSNYSAVQYGDLSILGSKEPETGKWRGTGSVSDLSFGQRTFYRSSGR